MNYQMPSILYLEDCCEKNGFMFSGDVYLYAINYYIDFSYDNLTFLLMNVRKVYIVKLKKKSLEFV